MKRIVFSILISLFVLNTFAQHNEICGYQTETERILRRNPDFLKWQEAWYNQAMSELMQLENAKRRIVADTLYLEIPVVFHVLYNTSQQNIHDSIILNQLEILNKAFRKRNSDTLYIRSIFKSLVADVKVQFSIAKTDPSGNPTNGITRTSTNRTTFAINRWGSYNTDMKYTGSGGKDAWDPTSYMNIWICNMEYPSFYSITYGFATPPTGAPNWSQFGNVTKDSTHLESGVVLHYKIVGSNNPQAPLGYTMGKAAIHEVGHYLGLRHVWGDGSSQTGCSVDDGIFDTPNARSSNASCSNQNSCTDGSNDLPDQTENFMDYTLGACAAMFTHQQAYMMRYCINMFRTGLPIREITYDTLPEQPGFAGFRLYPNPLKENDNFNISIEGAAGKYFSVSIIDMSGKLIYSRSVLSNTIHSFETSGMARSVYYVIVRDSEGKMTGREMLLLL